MTRKKGRDSESGHGFNEKTDDLSPALRPYFTLALIGAPFGLEGFVKVKSLSGETAHFSRLDKVILKLDGKEKVWKVAETLVRGNSLLMRFSGIDSPEAAGTLKGAEIIAERESAAPLKEGEYYIEDLKGLEVVNPDGKALGRVNDVLEGGGGSVAEVILHSGEKRLVPFRNEFFGEVSFEKGRIVLLENWILDL